MDHPPESEIQEIQRNELEALQSILGEDFTQVETKTAWKVSNPASKLHEFEITLRPEEEDLKPAVHAVLHVRLPKTYPRAIPFLSLVPGRAKGLSPTHLRNLGDALQSKAKTLLGAEMVWELVSYAQELISTQNLVAKANAAPNLSLEEEMRRRALEVDKAERLRLEAEAHQSRLAAEERSANLARLIEEEASKRADLLRQEKERRAAEASATSPRIEAPPPVENESLQLSGRGVETFLDPIDYNGRVTTTVRVGPLLRRTALGATLLVESAQVDPLDSVLSDGLSNPSVSHSTWHLDRINITSTHYFFSSGKRKLEEVEHELDRLLKFRQPNCVNVLASKLTRAGRAGEGAGWRLAIVTERPGGSSMSELLDQCDTLRWAKVRSYMHDLLSALDALHSHNFIHRGLDPSHIYLDPRPPPGPSGPQGAAGEGPAPPTTSVRLAGTGYWRRLLDMHRSNPLNECGPVEENVPEGWQAPEALDQPLSYTRKRDIWDLGRCVCQMLFGIDVLCRFASPEQLLSSDDIDLSPHVRQFLLTSIFERSQRKRSPPSTLLAKLQDLIEYEDSPESSSSATRRGVGVGGGASGSLGIPGSGPGAGPGTANGRPTLPGRPKSNSQQSIYGASPPTAAFLGNQRPGSFWQLRHPPSGSAQTPISGPSRYQSDFQEVEFLGKGAYGAVVKAQNRLDGRFYAIKKIRLSSTPAEDERTLREITALSRLNHPNIVRYVTCWIEESESPLEVERGMGTETGSGSELMTSSQSLKRRSSHAHEHGGGQMGEFGVGNAFGGMEDDFLSVGHNAFSQSASYPDIRFGYSDDGEDEEDDDDEDDEEKGKKNGSDSSSDSDSDSDSDSSEDSDWVGVSTARPRLRTLYIQMEYVGDGTLKEAIDAGLTDDQSWRIFRQIVEALVHITSLGIMHRDLKPSNVLMFGSGDVKIGDFGLATSNLAHNDGSGMAGSFHGAGGGGGGGGAGGGGNATQGTAEMVEGSGDLTSDIGTNLYIAPEVAKRGGAKYNGKVDMYSLGIIFFEMLASRTVYSTGMERVVLIRDMRQAGIKFPTAWPTPRWANQTKLIQMLLDHDPERRPSPLKVLKSDLLPPKMEDEYIEECLRLMSSPSSAYNTQLLQALFGRSAEANDLVRDFTFDTGAETDMDTSLVSVVLDHLRSVFHKHGAVELHAPLLLPRADVYSNERKPVQLLDKTGKVVHLPYDLTVPFARIIARSDHQRLKRYDIAPVYRENPLAGGQPRAVLEVDFDIVSPERTVAAEAEVLAVIEELLDDVPGLSSENWVFHLNHHVVLDLILERVPSKHRASVMAAISTFAAKTTTANARAVFLKLPLTRSIIEELESFNLCDEIGTVHTILERLVPLNDRSKLSRAVAEMSEAVAAARDLGVQRPIFFTPLLAHNNSFYKGGMLFQTAKAGKRKDIIAAGGRYDALVQQFSGPTSSDRRPPHAVGFQLAVGKVALALSRWQTLHVPRLISKPSEEERSFGRWTPRRCDVYVASGPGLFRDRLNIVRGLWAHNISADLMYEHATEAGPEATAATCRAEGILFLVFAKHSSMVKVKNVLRREEEEVARHDLAEYLALRIQEQHRIDMQSAGSSSGATRLTKESGGHGTVGVVSSGAFGLLTGSKSDNTMIAPPECELVLPERPFDRSKKGEKNNDRRTKLSHKQLLLDKASTHISRLADEIRQGQIPILAVDLSGSNFDRFVSSSSGGEDSFRHFLDTAPLHAEEREYVKLIRKRVQSELRRSKERSGSGSASGSASGVGGGSMGGGGAGGAGGGAAGGASGQAGNVNSGTGRVFLYSIREDRSALMSG